TSLTAGRVRRYFASSTVSQGFRRHGDSSSEPSETLSPSLKNRQTKNVLGPSVSSWWDTARLTPVIAEAMVITTRTPMTTPRMVSEARTLLARTESRAIPIPSKTLATGLPRPRNQQDVHDDDAADHDPDAHTERKGKHQEAGNLLPPFERALRGLHGEIVLLARLEPALDPHELLGLAQRRLHRRRVRGLDVQLVHEPQSAGGPVHRRLERHDDELVERDPEQRALFRHLADDAVGQPLD